VGRGTASLNIDEGHFSCQIWCKRLKNISAFKENVYTGAKRQLKFVNSKHVLNHTCSNAYENIPITTVKHSVSHVTPEIPNLVNRK
jgi:hypothetical protein